MRSDGKDRPIGLYVHVPFCVRKCLYCDFLSVSGTESEKHEMTTAVLSEMEKRKDEASGRPVDTVFIGGGTPSVLDVPEMERLLEGIHRFFPMEEVSEFTVECNPGTVSGEKFDLYRQLGVNRLSIGMQSAVDSELQKLGRIHTRRDFEECFFLARERGFSNINVDIMSAIPGQTTASYEETLRFVTELAPEHISSYSLIVEEGTPFYDRYGAAPPVDEDTDRAMYEKTGELLSDAGYTRYEISNYARPQYECRHNLKYWRRGEYLGFGPGAASFIGNCRFSNERDLRNYVKKAISGETVTAESGELTRVEEKSEFMYLGLRCMKGVSAREFMECFGVDMTECFGNAIRQCEEEGLLRWDGESLSLTERGIDVSNRVFVRFLI